MCVCVCLAQRQYCSAALPVLILYAVVELSLRVLKYAAVVPRAKGGGQKPVRASRLSVNVSGEEKTRGDYKVRGYGIH